MKSSEEILRDMTEGIPESAGVKLTAIGRKMGPTVVQEASKIAAEVAEGSGLNPQACLRGALWLSQFVGELRGVDVTMDHLAKCPVCRDSGFQLLADESGVRACPSCEQGCALEAGQWLKAVRPIGRGGKRYSSDKGMAEFREAFKHFPQRKERLERKMAELENQDKGQRQEVKVWD